MKKNILCIGGLIIIVLIGFVYYINVKKVPLKLEQNIEKISIRDGNNGKIVEITRNEDINIILYQINSLNLEKKYKYKEKEKEVQNEIVKFNNESAKLRTQR